MSQRLKSDVRRVERNDDDGREREETRQRDESEVEFERKRQEKTRDTDSSNERRHHRDHVEQRKRRHRSEDESVERRSRKNDRDVDRSRHRQSRDEDDTRRQRTGNRRHANGTNENHDASETEGKKEEADDDEKYMKAKRAKVEDTLTTRTGGAYIPPARLRMMQVKSVYLLRL